MRLWQRLFLVIASVGSIAVLAVLFAQQQAFRRGFVDYLNTLEAQRIEEIRGQLGEYYRDDPQWWSMRDDPRRWGDIVGGAPPARPPPQDPDDISPDPERPPRRFERPPLTREAIAERDRQGPQGRGEFGRREFDPDGQRAPADRPRPPRAGGGEFAGRLQLFDADGVRVAGAPQVPADAKLRRWPIIFEGNPVGELRLAPVRAPVAELDQQFAYAQQRRGLWTAALLLPLALLAAFLFSRLALRPLANFTRGFHELAGGRFDARLDSARRDEFGALAADFNRLAEALSRQRDSQRAYIADVAHELRTPIAILRGELHALEDGVRVLDRNAVDSLSVEVGRMTRLVEDLHLLAQSDTGALSYRMQRVDLVELLTDAAQTWAAQLERAGLNLLVDLPAAPAWIDGDAERLQQLLGNLLANSSRYTDAPGRVELALRRQGRDWQIVVADSAPGVPAAALPRLFERLYRVDSSRARSHGGAGLGLAIAARIVEAHRGRIGASASALGGVAVSVDLPAEPAR